MQQFFIELFEYQHHVNQKIIEVFEKDTIELSEKSVKLFNHILNAHHIWNCRIEGKIPQFAVWELHDFSVLHSINSTNYQQSLDILQQYDLNQKITYTNSKGDSFQNNVRDILFHLINHSTYHRGQIASDMKQHGLEPLASDYIFFKR